MAWRYVQPCCDAQYDPGIARLGAQPQAAHPGTNSLRAQALEEMQAKAADREVTAARLQEERLKAALLAQVAVLLCSPQWCTQTLTPISAFRQL